MEQCYEYLGCQKEDCIMRQRLDNKQCWEVEGTLCSAHAIEIMQKHRGKKIDVCIDCIYYKAVKCGDIK